MEKITVGGQDYELVFSMYTMELIEEKYGKVREIINRITRSEKPEIRLTRELFVMMVKTALWEKGLPEEVDDRPLRKLHFEDYNRLFIRPLMVIEIARGMKSETTGGNEADDEKHDAWLEEDEKNGSTGVS